MDSEIIKETECIVISYTNSLINKYKENKIMRDDYVHVLLFFLEIVDIPIIGKLQSKIKEVIIGILEEIKRDLYEKIIVIYIMQVWKMVLADWHFH